METIKFGESRKFNMKLFGQDKAGGIFVDLYSSSVTFNELTAALNGYGGDIYTFNETDEQIGEYHNYEDKPTIHTKYETDGNGNEVICFRVYLKNIQSENINTINEKLNILTQKINTLSGTILQNNENVAIALNAITALYEAGLTETEGN
ncbi:hypothetical protein [Lachnoclostridium sp. Marseille-P6806]|uniref:hypothetical protein n=1 Tax=Lachnoclostridium sp. Marseille-P6806 TaxID=2364793 RepID=UPI00103128AA|nr:hypothetical protein [Lachnoclostridium sp. Marseille-P6806]